MMTVKQINGSDAVLLREITPGVFSVDNGVTLTPLSTQQGILTAYDGTAGHVALPTSGLSLLTKATAGTNYTLAAPVAGTDDGKSVTITSTTAAAHVVTVGAGKINGATNGVATFAAAIGNTVSMRAYNGVWYVTNNIGVTIS